MKLNITLVLLALTFLLVGFNADFLSDDLGVKEHIYGFCDSAAWVIFSLFAYLAVRSLKIIGRDKTYQLQVKTLRRLCEVFMVLSVCPFINECFNKADWRLWSNYAYGAIVLLVYLTLWIVKKYRNARNQE